MCVAIETRVAIDGPKDTRDKADALQLYYLQASNVEAERESPRSACERASGGRSAHSAASRAHARAFLAPEEASPSLER